MNHKYSEQTKLAAVLAYMDGNGGLKEVAKVHEVDVSSLRKWIADYREHGLAAMQNRNSVRRRYSPEFKLAVLLRVQEEGLSYRQAAALFDIRRFNAIADWEQRYQEGGIDALTDQRRKNVVRKIVQNISKGPPISDDARSQEELLAEVNQLRAENAYLKKLDALALANKQSALLRRRK
jgi:transposase